jgi:DNA-binding Lrp family transcriptional regulator
MKDETTASLRAFAKSVARFPDVVEATYVTGSADIVLRVQTATMDTYADFATRLLTTTRPFAATRRLPCCAR